MHYRDLIQPVAQGDVDQLQKKDREYGGSWLKRGGIGAFMMLARKWDRIETAMTQPVVLRPSEPAAADMAVSDYDVITRAVCDGREEGILDDIGDLRRYLLLIEAQIRVQLQAGRDRDEAALREAAAKLNSQDAPTRGG